MNNLFSNIPTDLVEELTDSLLTLPAGHIERIVSHGHASPEGFWYDQEEFEWVMLLKGEAKLLFEGDGDPIHIKPGDFVSIPAHKRHRVEWTIPDEPTIWLAVHYVHD